jgi:hypothetical protein
MRIARIVFLSLVLMPGGKLSGIRGNPKEYRNYSDKKTSLSMRYVIVHEIIVNLNP